MHGLRLRTGYGDGPMSTPQIGSQTAVVDVEDCLRQEVRDDEHKQRVDGLLKTVPRRLADYQRVVVYVQLVSHADVEVDDSGCRDDDGQDPDDDERDERASYAHRAAVWRRRLMPSWR